MQCMYIHFQVNTNSTFLGLTLQGGTRQVAIFSGTDPMACKPYIQILFGIVFGRFPFSLGGLLTVFSFKGTATRTNGNVLK